MHPFYACMSFQKGFMVSFPEINCQLLFLGPYQLKQPISQQNSLVEWCSLLINISMWTDSYSDQRKWLACIFGSAQAMRAISTLILSEVHSLDMASLCASLANVSWQSARTRTLSRVACHVSLGAKADSLLMHNCSDLKDLASQPESPSTGIGVVSILAEVASAAKERLRQKSTWCR